MINKLARVLLNSIKRNESKQKINRIARLLHKVASEASYKETVIDNFIAMFGSINQGQLLQVIYNYKLGLSKGPKPHELKLEGNYVPPAKVLAIKTALKDKFVSMRKISKMANDMIEGNANIKSMVMKFTKVEVENTNVVTPTGEVVSFKFNSTDHLGHRCYLRDITTKDLNLALNDLAISFLSNQTKTLSERNSEFKDAGDKYSFTTKAKKASAEMYITIIFALKGISSKEIEMTLVTVFPDESKGPTIPGEAPEGYKVLERASEAGERIRKEQEEREERVWQIQQARKREEEKKQEEKKLEAERLKQQQLEELKKENPEITKEDLDAQNWLQNRPAKKEISRSFMIWDPYSTKTVRATGTDLVKANIKYSSNLSYSITPLGLDKLLDRLGIVLRVWGTKTEEFQVKIQIPCFSCRKLKDGSRIGDKAYVTLWIQKNKALKYDYEITNFAVNPSPDAKDPQAWYRENSYESIPKPL